MRKTINPSLPDGYEEGMQFGIIGWYVPLSMYPAGYGGIISAFQFSVFSVSEGHMGNYRAARALMGKGKSSAKKGARKSALKKAKPKK